jgi:hypothetical protein
MRRGRKVVIMMLALALAVMQRSKRWKVLWEGAILKSIPTLIDDDGVDAVL